jgi:hypothetical protein
MKVWPIDPLVPRNLRLEVPEKLPQGLIVTASSALQAAPVVPFALRPCRVRSAEASDGGGSRQHAWLRGSLVDVRGTKRRGNASACSPLGRTGNNPSE